jgi:hypothetical protein
VQLNHAGQEVGDMIIHTLGCLLVLGGSLPLQTPGVAVYLFEGGVRSGAEAERVRHAVLEALRRQPVRVVDRVETTEPVRFGLLGWVAALPGGRLAVALYVFDIESAEQVARASVTSSLAQLPGALDSTAGRIAVAINSHLAHSSPSPRRGALPAAATMPFARGHLSLDRGDRAAAEQHFRAALQAAPGWREACTELRKLRPRAACR